MEMSERGINPNEYSYDPPFTCSLLVITLVFSS
jgi:hypothetical protein